MADDTRGRILAAAVECVSVNGIAKTSLDAVADRAGVGRATIYRHFPGGRDEVFEEAIAREVAVFFRRLADEVDGCAGLAAQLEVGLPFAHRALSGHEVFQKVVETEPERLLPHLSISTPLIIDALHDYLTPLLEAEELDDGVDVDEVADFLARMILTFTRGQGVWNLDDPDEVRTLVHGYLLAGVLRHPEGTS